MLWPPARARSREATHPLRQLRPEAGLDGHSIARCRVPDRERRERKTPPPMNNKTISLPTRRRRKSVITCPKTPAPARRGVRARGAAKQLRARAHPARPSTRTCANAATLAAGESECPRHSPGTRGFRANCAVARAAPFAQGRGHAPDAATRLAAAQSGASRPWSDSDHRRPLLRRYSRRPGPSAPSIAARCCGLRPGQCARACQRTNRQTAASPGGHARRSRA